MNSEDNKSRNDSELADSMIDGLYPRSSQDLPPESLDKLILTKAHNANKKPESGSPFSGGWKIPFSMAAVMVLGLAVLLRLGVSPEDPYLEMHKSMPAPVKSVADMDAAISIDQELADDLVEEVVGSGVAAEKPGIQRKKLDVRSMEVINTGKELQDAAASSPAGEVMQQAVPEKKKRKALKQEDQLGIMGSHGAGSEQFQESTAPALESKIVEMKSHSQDQGLIQPVEMQSPDIQSIHNGELELQECITTVESLIAETDLVASSEQLKYCQQKFPDADFSTLETLLQPGVKRLK